MPSRPNLGPCTTCEYRHDVRTDRGRVFLMCKLHFEDRSFAKYPRLPVLHCRGYIEGGEGQKDSTPPGQARVPGNQSEN